MKIDIAYITGEEREAGLIERFAVGVIPGVEVIRHVDRSADKHCRECICVSCDRIQTNECVEGADLCEKCDHNSHTGRCPWHPDEQ